MAGRNTNDLLFENGYRLIQFYRSHPCLAAYDLLGVDLAAIQRLVLRDIWFKNNVLVVATRGWGKSSSVDSLSLIENKGLVYLHEVLPKVPVYLKDGQEDTLSLDMSIYTTEGTRPVSKVALEKKLVGKKLTTFSKFVHKGSSHHPLLTLDKGGCFVYKQLKDFKIGDNVCIQKSQNVFGNITIPLEDSYLLGLFMSDNVVQHHFFMDIFTEDDEVTDFYNSYFIGKQIPFRMEQHNEVGNIIYKMNVGNYNDFFEKYNINKKVKEVPFTIRSATSSVQKKFLQGFFDAEGTIDEQYGLISCCSSSEKLLQEVQLMLLNFGVVSAVFEEKNKLYPDDIVYCLKINFESSFYFKDLIGFGLEKKQNKLNRIFRNNESVIGNNIIPHVADICYKINEYYINSNNVFGKSVLLEELGEDINITYNILSNFLNRVTELEKKGYKLAGVQDEINKLKIILEYNYFFDVVNDISDWTGDCYDFEMDMEDYIEPNYFANGFISHNTFILSLAATLTGLLYPGQQIGLISPSFRQSKKIFSEVETLYDSSALLRSACSKKPIHGSDLHYLQFKKVNGRGSFIQAVPLGDGSKIRGSRYYVVVIDELAQIDPSILDRVVRPMAATARNPMERVRAKERQKRLIKQGLATTEDFEDDTVNKIIMASSGYFKFNHLWNRMSDYWNQTELAQERNKAELHAVWQIPYWELPEGFLDKDMLEEAKRTMSDLEFRMEYGAEMVRDSEGFFKASLLDERTVNNFSVEVTGKSDSEYVLGIDPSQGGSADCGIVVLKLDHGIYKIVNVLTVNSEVHKNMAKAIQRLYRNYNVARIYMDKGGGGKAVAELLADGYEGEVLLPIDDSAYDHLEGKRVVSLVAFTPTWIHDANFSTIAMLENEKLFFPFAPKDSFAESVEVAYEKIMALKRQMLNVVVTETRSGMLHFDTPKKGQKKDLYSALILAVQGAKDLELERELDMNKVVLSHGVGYVRAHKTQEEWRPINNIPKKAVVGDQAGGSSVEVLGHALLDPSKRKPHKR